MDYIVTTQQRAKGEIEAMAADENKEPLPIVTEKELAEQVFGGELETLSALKVSREDDDDHDDAV